VLNKKLTLLIFSLSFITVIFLSGCVQQQTQKEDSTVPTSSSQKESISIKDFAFNPEVLTIKVGTTVIWTNEDSVPHTITSEGNFNSETLGKGKTYEHTFNTIGIYDYHCGIHPSMRGKIIVD